MEKKITIIIIEIICLCIIGLLIGTTSGGTLWSGDINVIDEGQFAAWANHMLLGKAMFKDIYITYGPLYVYPLYLLFKFIGQSAFLVRFYLILGSIFSTIVLLLLLHKLKFKATYRWIVLIIVLVLPALTLRQGLGFLSLFFLLSLKEHKIHTYAVLLGISAAIAFLVSPDIGLMIFIIVLLYYVGLLIQAKNVKYPLRSLALFCAGLFSSLFVFIVWALHGGWFWQYINTTIDVIVSLSGSESSIGYAFPNAIEILSKLPVKELFSREMILYWGIAIYISTACYFFVKILTRTLSPQDKRMFLIYLFGILLFLILIGRWGLGHFFFALPPILIILSYFTQILIERVIDTNKSSEKVLGIIIVCVIIFFLLRIVKFDAPQILYNILGIKNITKSKTGPKRIGPIPVSNQQKEYTIVLRKFVDKNTSKEDSIFFFSNEPLYYMVTNRRNPTRYDLPYIATSPGKRYEILHDFINNPPKYIFDDTSDWAVDGLSNARRLPEIVSYIKKNYKKAGTIQHTIIYELRSSPITE